MPVAVPYHPPVRCVCLSMIYLLLFFTYTLVKVQKAVQRLSDYVQFRGTACPSPSLIHVFCSLFCGCEYACDPRTIFLSQNLSDFFQISHIPVHS